MSGDFLRDSAGRELSEGTLVRYHGTLAALHGEWTVDGPCLCEECFAQYAMYGEHHLVLSAPARKQPLAHVSQSSVTLAAAPAPEPDVTQLRQARPGDVIAIPGQYPAQFTVRSLTTADPDGHFLTLTWATAAGQGRRQLTSATRITLVSRPAADTPPQGVPAEPGTARAVPRSRNQPGAQPPRPGPLP